MAPLIFPRESANRPFRLAGPCLFLYKAAL